MPPSSTSSVSVSRRVASSPSPRRGIAGLHRVIGELLAAEPSCSFNEHGEIDGCCPRLSGAGMGQISVTERPFANGSANGTSVMARTAVSFRTGDIVLAGVFGGAIFAAFEMVAAALLTGWDSLFNPLRMIGALLLGANALDQGYPLVTAATTGLIVHLVLSVLFATIFAAIVPQFSTVAALSLSGIVFGAIL